MPSFLLPKCCDLLGISMLRRSNMPITVLPETQKAELQAHGHSDRWEIVVDATGAFIECTKCGLLVVQLTVEPATTEGDNPHEIFA